MLCYAIDFRKRTLEVFYDSDSVGLFSFDALMTANIRDFMWYGCREFHYNSLWSYYEDESRIIDLLLLRARKYDIQCEKLTKSLEARHGGFAHSVASQKF